MKADSLVISNDMKYLGNALMNTNFTSNNTDFTSASTYANTLYQDSQKAMDGSDLYNVSPDLQGANDEYQLLMVQAHSAAVYVYSGVEECKKGNIETGISEITQAIPNINSFIEHFSKTQNLLKAYKLKN